MNIGPQSPHGSRPAHPVGGDTDPKGAAPQLAVDLASSTAEAIDPAAQLLDPRLGSLPRKRPLPQEGPGPSFRSPASGPAPKKRRTSRPLAELSPAATGKAVLDLLRQADGKPMKPVDIAKHVRLSPTTLSDLRRSGDVVEIHDPTSPHQLFYVAREAQPRIPGVPMQTTGATTTATTTHILKRLVALGAVDTQPLATGRHSEYRLSDMERARLLNEEVGLSSNLSPGLPNPLASSVPDTRSASKLRSRISRTSLSHDPSLGPEPVRSTIASRINDFLATKTGEWCSSAEIQESVSGKRPDAAAATALARMRRQGSLEWKGSSRKMFYRLASVPNSPVSTTSSTTTSERKDRPPSPRPAEDRS